MSLFGRINPPLRSNARALRRPALVSSFRTSSARSMLDENNLDNPDRKEKIEKAEKDSIEKAKEGKGEWKPELASASEQSVQAEKSNLTMEEMEKLGEEKAKQQDS